MGTFEQLEDIYNYGECAICGGLFNMNKMISVDTLYERSFLCKGCNEAAHK